MDDDQHSGRSWSEINRTLLDTAMHYNYVLPYTTAERQACKALVSAGKLEPNGCLGYRLSAANKALRRRAAHERRVLLRAADPLVAAALKLAALRSALIASHPPRSPEDFTHAAGDCECSVCGDLYRDHPEVPGPEPFLTVLCNGEQVKL